MDTSRNEDILTQPPTASKANAQKLSRKQPTCQSARILKKRDNIKELASKELDDKEETKEKKVVGRPRKGHPKKKTKTYEKS